MPAPARFLPALTLVLLALLFVCSCSSHLHLVQTRSGKGYIARLKPEHRTESGVFIFEDQDRMLVMVHEDEVLEIRPIDAVEARHLGGTVFFPPSGASFAD